MREQTFEHNGASLTVHNPTIESALLRDLLIATLHEHYPKHGLLVWYYASLAANTAIQGDLNGWMPPEMGDSEADIIANFEEFRVLDGEMFGHWRNTFDAVSAPEPKPLEQEKKAKSSSE